MSFSLASSRSPRSPALLGRHRDLAAALLSILAIVPGMLAALLEHGVNPLRIAERHHSHHDTYVVSPDFLRSLVVAMLIVGCVGVLLGIFCMIGLFDAGQEVLLAFAVAFNLTMFGMWLLLSRYKVSFFRDRGVITPFLGRDVCFFYNDVESLDWKGVRRSSGYRDLVVREKGGRALRIWGIVDIEQVLLHVDRFDVLAPLNAEPGVGTPLDMLDLRIGTWQPFAREGSKQREGVAARVAAKERGPVARRAGAGHRAEVDHGARLGHRAEVDHGAPSEKGGALD